MNLLFHALHAHAVSPRALGGVGGFIRAADDALVILEPRFAAVGDPDADGDAVPGDQSAFRGDPQAVGDGQKLLFSIVIDSLVI